MPGLRLRWLFGLFTPLLLPGALAFGLARLLPLGWAAVAFLAASAGLALVGCFVLRTTAIQQITWRNHLAGHLLPFAQCMGGGTLLRVGASSVLGSAAVGGAVFVWLALAANGTPPGWPLALAWLLDLLTLLFVATTTTRSYRFGAPGARQARRVLAFVLVQVGVSLALHLTGHPTLAALVAGLPQALLLAWLLLYLGIVLTAGRNARWN